MKKYKTKIVFILFAIILVIYTNSIIGFFPTYTYLKNCAINSIEKANNFNWTTYQGYEGSEYFTNKLKKELFGEDVVDLKYIKEFQLESEGFIEDFSEINISDPSVTFISYRKVKDKDYVREFRAQVTYRFKFEKFHWLIDEVTYEMIPNK